MKEDSQTELSLSARLLQAQDAERRRISRELHDSVGQCLSAVLMNLEILAKSSSDKTLQETIDLVNEASREVRTVSHLLHPPILDIAGLAAAINWYLDGFSQRSGVKAEIELPKDLPRLPIEKDTALFRIVQECLTNVHHHARASHVSIRMTVDEGKLRLEVTDNGKGMDTGRLPSKPDMLAKLGVGILGMRERLRELGGSLQIESSAQGTRVIATMPIDQKAEAASKSSEATPTMGANVLLARGEVEADLPPPHPPMKATGDAMGIESLIDFKHRALKQKIANAELTIREWSKGLRQLSPEETIALLDVLLMMATLVLDRASHSAEDERFKKSA